MPSFARKWNLISIFHASLDNKNPGLDTGALKLRLLLHRFDEFLKLLRMINCHLTQNLSIDGNFFVGHFLYEGAVFFPVFSEGGVEAEDPKAAKSPFLVPAVSVSVFSRFKKSFFRGSVGRFPAPHETFGGSQHFFSSL